MEPPAYHCTCSPVISSSAGANVEAIKEEYVAPLVGYLTSDANEETTGGLFQVAGGWIAQIRWERAGGHGFPVNRPLEPEHIISKWKLVTDFGNFTLERLRQGCSQDLQTMGAPQTQGAPRRHSCRYGTFGAPLWSGAHQGTYRTFFAVDRRKLWQCRRERFRLGKPVCRPRGSRGRCQREEGSVGARRV